MINPKKQPTELVDVSCFTCFCCGFVIPNQGIDAASYRASKPLVALAHLVAHQGPGSLSCWLQKQGWLPDNLGPKVTAQAPFSTQNFAIWELKIKLSQQGGPLFHFQHVS